MDGNTRGRGRSGRNVVRRMVECICIDNTCRYENYELNIAVGVVRKDTIVHRL